jgi:phage gp16-like protein
MAKRPNKYPVRYAEKNKDIQLIHIGAEQLGMDTQDKSDSSEYRSMLWSIARVHSSADLDFAGRKKVLDHLKACGFKVRATGKEKAKPSRVLAEYPESKKIRALWIMLHELGAVKNPSEAALAAYVKRMTKVDDLHWIDGHQAETVIESLKKWAMRFLPTKVEALARECAEAIKSGALKLPDEEIEALQIKVGTAQSRGTFDPMQWAYEALTKAMKEVTR